MGFIKTIGFGFLSILSIIVGLRAMKVVIKLVNSGFNKLEDLF